MSVPSRPFRLLVDLVHLQPGGANGGIKPFILEMLGWLGRQQQMPLLFTFLTRSSTHREVRDRLARVEDEIVCVHDDGDGSLPRPICRLPRERVLIPAPADLAWLIRADALYCPFGPPTYACPGIPTICLVADTLHRDFPAGLSGTEVASREVYFQRITRVADAIQCISRNVMARLQAHYAIPEERMFCTHIAIQSRFESPDRLRSPVGKAPPSFFFPANAWPHKNHETLLLAYRLYRKRELALGRHPWGLVLTGHEDQRWRDLQSIAATLGLLPAVSFRGFVDLAEMHVLWLQAGALVFPSLHEGFGIPLVEAMHYGVPIVASDATSLPEVAGGAALLVDARRPRELADAMFRVANEPDLRRQLTTRGSRRALDFSMAQEAGRFLDCLRNQRAGQAWRPSTLGILEAGLIRKFALIDLPTIPTCCRLEIVAVPLSASRRVILGAGDACYGEFVLPRRKAPRITFDLVPNGKPLRIEVSEVCESRWRIKRRDGIHVTEAKLIKPDGTSLNLLSSP